MGSTSETVSDLTSVWRWWKTHTAAAHAVRAVLSRIVNDPNEDRVTNEWECVNLRLPLWAVGQW